MQRAQNARVRQGHGNYLPPGQLQQQQQSFHHQQQQHQHEAAPLAHHVAAPAAALPPGAPAHLTSTTFASLPLSLASQRALHELEQKAQSIAKRTSWPGPSELLQCSQAVKPNSIQPLKDVAILTMFGGVTILFYKSLNILEASNNSLLAR
jgi:hypothetical protein